MIKKTYSILCLILVILILAVIFYWKVVIYSPINSNSAKEISFIVKPGQSISKIIDNLKKQGFIRNKLIFKIYILLTNQKKFIASEHILRKNMSLAEIVKELSANIPRNQERTITIIEGWNINDIANYFEKNKITDKSTFLDLTRNSQWLLKKKDKGIIKDDLLLKMLQDKKLEGFLFPDTYRIYKNASPEQVIIKMLNNFDKKIAPYKNEIHNNKIAGSKRTLYEIITMASILEKEVRTYQDKRLVSGIFWKRIEKNQPLESCATLAYALKKNKYRYSSEDIKVKSLYNTYQNKGLPPSPICNPGLDSIKAALHPKFSQYNYFLNRPSDGKTIFSRTLREHNINKEKYLE